jgi:hypothetical protein
MLARALQLVLVVAGSVRAAPSIESVGNSINMNVDDGGALTVKVGNGQQHSISGVFATVATLQSDLRDAIATAATMATAADRLSIRVGVLESDAENDATAMDGLRANITSAVEDVRLLNRKNLLCIADVITGVIPPNTEPVHGQCNLTTGGKCIVTCKSGYRPSSSRNLAIGRPVHLTGASHISAGYYTENVVNGRFDRSNISDRLLAGCTNSLCSVAVDLGFMYNNISQFKAYTGYSGCQPGQLTCDEQSQYFGTMGDCSHYIQVWTGSPSTSLADANVVDPEIPSVEHSGWTTVVAHPKPSRLGEEHPSMNPPVSGRYVRYLTDNRYSATSSSEGCVRGGRWLRLYEFEVLTHATEEYSCAADGLSATSEDLECSIEVSRNNPGA